MILYMGLIGLLALIGLKIDWKGFHSDYIGRDSTMPIRGIFILLIIARHFMNSLAKSSPLWDPYYLWSQNFTGQLVVSLFLFYSGYGILESIHKRGQEYLHALPTRRVGKLVFQTGMVVVLFVVFQFSRGNTYSLPHILLACVGWTGVGFDNWYVFAILFLYLATYLSFRCFDDERLALWGVGVLTVFYVYIMFQAGRAKSTWCYNTIFTYLAGMLYARYKPQIEKVVFSSNRTYWFTVFLLLLCFRMAHQYWYKLVWYELTSILFALLVVLLTAKFKLTNPVLHYAGVHLFSLYILHRLPMIALKETAVAASHWAYFAAVLVITFALSWAFDKLVPALWGRLCPGKKPLKEG